MRILITNDDGVFAPGIAALARGLSVALGAEHEFFVVAPLTDHSGASSAVGRVYEREAIPYETVQIPGLTRVPIYGIDGTPALAVILACIEGFGPRPDLVVSGINHGLNTGRSVLHSGTVGATLTAAQFGVRGLAVSIAWGEEPVPWESPVALAVALVPFIAGLAPASVFNLNVPALPADQAAGPGPRHPGPDRLDPWGAAGADSGTSRRSARRPHGRCRDVEPPRIGLGRRAGRARAGHRCGIGGRRLGLAHSHPRCAARTSPTWAPPRCPPHWRRSHHAEPPSGASTAVGVTDLPFVS